LILICGPDIGGLLGMGIRGGAAPRAFLGDLDAALFDLSCKYFERRKLWQHSL
jgi:hypothetical protein